jgi:hypothetical protein
VTPERGILKLIVERLEPLVGHIRIAHHSAWVGSKDEKLTPERWIELHLVRAFLMARDALQSDDEGKIADAATWAPGFERAGMSLREALHVAKGKQRTKRGGLKRGEVQRNRATIAWAPYVATYHEYRAKGASVPSAREWVRKRIDKDGFIPPGGQEELPPTPRTIRNWLRDP